MARPRVVVVTGGGGGIGAAIAEELGRTGHVVVTMDPLVSVDGTEQLPAPEETTAGRIVAAGGTARASTVSVTDADGVQELFAGLVDEFGGLDGVINVAGITRPTSFTRGSEEDWLGVLSVHLDGYRNVLEAALPIMAAAGSGRILGVTSGSGWRPADTGAYGCAKRAVASLTWQLGRVAPSGVVVNAMSPIAMTRMVAAALGRARPAGSSPASGPSGARSTQAPGSRASATGGLSLGSMPTPDQLGPFGAHLVGEAFGWCSGEVLFAGGPEVAVVERPRLLEVVRTDGAASLAHVLETVTATALAKVEADQATTGATNPRFGPLFDTPDDGDVDPGSERPAVHTCAVISDRPDVAAAVRAVLDARGVTTVSVDVSRPTTDFAGATDALAAAVDRADGRLDAVVLALAGPPSASTATAWEQVLAEHTDLVARLHTDAAWARAVADLAARTERPVRLVTLTDATTSGGRSRAQAVAQHARSARPATKDLVAAFAVSVETGEARDLPALGTLTGHLLCSDATPALSGAELVVGTGWFGLRSHPRPTGSITFGGPAVPAWLDDALREIVGTARA